MSFRDAAPPKQVCYIATNSALLCLDADTGEIIWRADVPSHGSPLVLLLHEQRLYCASGGDVSCFDTGGRQLWAQSLTGKAPVTLAIDDTVPGGRLFVSTAGLVYALVAETGDVLWKNGLRGLGYEPISLRVPHATATASSVQVRRGDRTHTLSLDQS